MKNHAQAGKSRFSFVHFLACFLSFLLSFFFTCLYFLSHHEETWSRPKRHARDDTRLLSFSILRTDENSHAFLLLPRFHAREMAKTRSFPRERATPRSHVFIDNGQIIKLMTLVKWCNIANGVLNNYRDLREVILTHSLLIGFRVSLIFNAS